MSFIQQIEIIFMSFINYLNFSELSQTIQMQASLFEYFVQSNSAGKCILFILMVFSILAWSVIIGKLLQVNRLNALNKQHQLKLNQANGVLQLDFEDLSYQGGPHSDMTAVALKAYARYGDVSHDGDKADIDLLMGHIENAMDRSVAEQSLKYEEKMVLLGSIVSGAPFLGLLGTVWGVMDAFGAMSVASSASLQALAPGVSGALLTTVAALVVAIPSVFGYNYLLQTTKIALIELENFSSTISDRIELEVRGSK